MIMPKHLNIRTLMFILLPIAVASVAVSWDLQRLDKDFNHLYSLLKTARWDAFYKDTTIIVRFNGNVVTVTNQKDSKNMTTTIPMIARVQYDTTLGNNMIVYDWRGTAANNKRVHGGEIMLKSLLGFHRYIHVNCNGLVTEGRYPEET
jgi:Tfp pilus assembly protein FimT